MPAVKCILLKKKCFIFPLRFFFCAYFFSNLVGIHFFCTTFFPVLPKQPSKLRAVTACDLERQPVNSTISLYFKCYYVKTQILKYNQFLSPHWCFNSEIFLFVCFWDQFVLMLCFAFFESEQILTSPGPSRLFNCSFESQDMWKFENSLGLNSNEQSPKKLCKTGFENNQ